MKTEKEFETEWRDDKNELMNLELRENNFDTAYIRSSTKHKLRFPLYVKMCFNEYWCTTYQPTNKKKDRRIYLFICIFKTIKEG